MTAAQRHRNEVELVGRVESAPTPRVSAAGGHSVSWRLAVQRLPEPPPPASAPRDGGAAPSPAGRAMTAVDSIDCVAVLGELLQRVPSWAPGDLIEVSGQLRRRFWRDAGGVRSRCEVEVSTARQLESAGPAASGQAAAQPASSE